MVKKKEDLRSARWFAPDDLRSMGHRSRAMQMGLDQADWEGKPVIAIINTWSDLSPCHHHLRDRAEFVKKGIYQAGGMPVEMPVHSFSEQFLKPTSMLYRNMGAFEVEETLRSHPPRKRRSPRPKNMTALCTPHGAAVPTTTDQTIKS